MEHNRIPTPRAVIGGGKIDDTRESTVSYKKQLHVRIIAALHCTSTIAPFRLYRRNARHSRVVQRDSKHPTIDTSWQQCVFSSLAVAYWSRSQAGTAKWLVNIHLASA